MNILVIQEEKKEHSRSLKKPESKSYKNMPLALHRKKHHYGRLTKFRATILEKESINKKRLNLEANHVKYSNPTIKVKEKKEQILKLLMPFKEENHTKKKAMEKEQKN